MKTDSIGSARRLVVQEQIRKQVIEKLQELSRNPDYCALPLDSKDRMYIRRRMLARLRTQFPNATIFMIQRALEQVAQDLKNRKETT